MTMEQFVIPEIPKGLSGTHFTMEQFVIPEIPKGLSGTHFNSPPTRFG
jgi:hypothetical protein